MLPCGTRMRSAGRALLAVLRCRCCAHRGVGRSCCRAAPLHRCGSPVGTARLLRSADLLGRAGSKSVRLSPSPGGVWCFLARNRLGEEGKNPSADVLSLVSPPPLPFFFLILISYFHSLARSVLKTVPMLSSLDKSELGDKQMILSCNNNNNSNKEARAGCCWGIFDRKSARSLLLISLAQREACSLLMGAAQQRAAAEESCVDFTLQLC